MYSIFLRMTGLRGCEITGKIIVNAQLIHIWLVWLNYSPFCEYLRKYLEGQDFLLWP